MSDRLQVPKMPHPAWAIVAGLVLAATIAMAALGAEPSPACGSSGGSTDVHRCVEEATKNGPPALISMPNRDWHLLAVSYGGTVSLIKDLTKDECEKTRSSLMWIPDGFSDVAPGTIKRAECFQ